MSDYSGRRVPENLDRVFAIGVVLNVAYVLTLVVFGILGHSLALLADAGTISAMCSHWCSRGPRVVS
jgi:Co/Zn/Cd efflux system component